DKEQHQGNDRDELPQIRRLAARLASGHLLGADAEGRPGFQVALLGVQQVDGEASLLLAPPSHLVDPHLLGPVDGEVRSWASLHSVCLSPGRLPLDFLRAPLWPDDFQLPRLDARVRPAMSKRKKDIAEKKRETVVKRPGSGSNARVAGQWERHHQVVKR